MEPEIPNLQETSTEKKTSKRRIFILVLTLILILSGFTSVLALRIWDPLWNPFRPAPERVIARMSLEIGKVKTSQQKLIFSLIGENEGRFELKGNLEGKIDQTQKDKPKSEVQFDLNFSFTEKEAPMGMKFALAGEVKEIDEILYLKLTTIPVIPFLGMMGIDFSQFKDQWLKVDQESMIEFQKKIMGEMWTPEMEEKVKKETEKQKIIQKELQKEIEKILLEKKLFLVKKEFPDQKINGIKTHHYLASLDNEELSKIISKIWKKIEEIMLREYGTSPTFEEGKIKEILDKIGEISGEIWIGKKDYLLYKAKGEKSFDLAKFVEGEKGIVSIALELEFLGFNQPLKIEPPPEYKGIEEVLTLLIEESLTASQRKARDARIMADMHQLRTIAELIDLDENSYQGLCSGLTLNEKHPIYGSDFKALENDIKEMLEGDLDLHCYSSVESYCVETDLASPEGGRYCIDSAGKAGEIEDQFTCIGKGIRNNPYRCPERKILPEQMRSPLKEDPSLFQASILESFLKILKK